MINGSDLQQVIKKLRLTQVEASKELGVSQSTISTAINKKDTEISYQLYQSLKALADKKGIDIDNIGYASVKTEVQNVNRDQLSTSKPYYAVDVFGSPGMDIVDQEEQFAQPMFYISVPELKDVDIYIRVTGDSMYPKYRHGDIIGIKKLNAREFFAWYEPYVVVTKGNYQRLLKYIHPHPNDSNMLHLVSYDSNKFPPQPIDVDSIHEIWQVLGKIEL